MEENGSINYRPVMRRAGLETYFCTGVLVTFFLAIPNYLSIILTKAGRHDLTAGIYAHTALLASVMSALGTVISFLLIRYFYLKAFRQLGKEEIAKKNVWFAFMSVYYVPGMASYAFNMLTTKPSPVNEESVRDNGMFLVRFLVLSVGIVLTAVVTVSVFYLLYRLLDGSPAVENENRFVAPYIIIAAASVLRIVLQFAVGTPPDVFRLVRFAIEIIAVILVVFIAKDKQKMNNRFLTNTLPVIFAAVCLLTQIVPK